MYLKYFCDDIEIKGCITISFLGKVITCSTQSELISSLLQPYGEDTLNITKSTDWASVTVCETSSRVGKI